MREVMSYLTAKMLQGRFGISRRTLHRWVQTGVLPAPIRPSGGYCYWNEAEVEAAFQQHLELGSRNITTATEN